MFTGGRNFSSRRQRKRQPCAGPLDPNVISNLFPSSDPFQDAPLDGHGCEPVFFSLVFNDGKLTLILPNPIGSPNDTYAWCNHCWLQNSVCSLRVFITVTFHFTFLLLLPSFLYFFNFLLLYFQSNGILCCHFAFFWFIFEHTFHSNQWIPPSASAGTRSWKRPLIRFGFCLFTRTRPLEIYRLVSISSFHSTICSSAITE